MDTSPVGGSPSGSDGTAMPGVCLFGGYDPTHSRVGNLRDALRRAGFPVVEVQSRSGNLIRRFGRLILGFLRRGREADVLLVGAAGQRYVFLARVLAWLAGQRLILDAFISHYLVLVEDLERHRRGGPRAQLLRLLDQWACKLSDRVLLDTQEHVEYFVDRFELSSDRFRVVHLGADPDLFHPGKPPAAERSVQTVLCYGTFFPLQGMPLVARAARHFTGNGVRLVLAGDGPEKEETLRILDETGVEPVEDLGWVERDEVAHLVREADVCLGHFGETPQAHVVIPFKVYEVLSSARPLLTGRSRALERVLEHGRHVWFCERNSQRSIARGVLRLLDDRQLRSRLARAGRRRYEEAWGPDVLAGEIREACLGG